MAALIEGSDGQLYGTASQGGTGNAGTVLRLNKDGSGYANIINFRGTDGRSPMAALIQGNDGVLYGNTQLGGYFNGGVVFRMNTDGSSYQVLHEFAGGAADGFGPSTPLLEATNGAIYGSTPLGHESYGYRRSEGTIFRIDKNGSGYQLLTNRIIWRPRLLRTSDGTFYGSHSQAVFKLISDMTDYETVRYFDRGGGDGELPMWLIECSDGLLYGLTWGPYHLSGGGTIFKIRKDGTGYTTIFTFRNEAMNIGFAHALLEGTDGRLYGASADGGSFGLGAIFRLNKDGSGFAIITSFDGTNGIGPGEGLVQASDGHLYGTAGVGGTYGVGTVFRAQIDGNGLAALHHFRGTIDNTDGGHPHAGLLEGSDGWLYGVSHLFGIAEQGTVFKLRKDGSDYQQLFGFPDLDSHYQGPCSALIEGSDGALYGPTMGGGSEQGGILFRLNKDGTGYRVILNLKRGFFNDMRRVIEGTDGVLYGLTLMGGSADQGMLFKVRHDGTGYAVLHDFTNTGGDGGGAWGPMIEGSDGAIYGLTRWGGHMNVGTLFRYVPPPEMSVQWHAGGYVSIAARALSGNLMVIEGSPDLTTWTEVSSGMVTNGELVTDDPQTSQFSYRFYRARLR